MCREGVNGASACYWLHFTVEHADDDRHIGQRDRKHERSMKYTWHTQK
jgi:hypothetical protein